MARLSLIRSRVAVFRIVGAAGILATFAAMTPSCFITSTPDFQPPSQTPPLLDGNTASPPLGDVIIAQPNTEIDLKAGLRSEDAGEDVAVYLYVDYGLNTVPDQPYAIVFPIGTVGASTISDDSRYASITWKPQLISPGCHRLTMMVSHKFNFIGGVTCPADLSDSSALSWDLLLCSSTASCPAFDPTSSCQPSMATERDCPAMFVPEKASTSSSGSGG